MSNSVATQTTASITGNLVINANHEGEELVVISSSGKVVFSTEDYKELMLKLEVLIEMVDKRKFQRKLKKVKETKRIIKGLVE